MNCIHCRETAVAALALAIVVGCSSEPIASEHQGQGSGFRQPQAAILSPGVPEFRANGTLQEISRVLPSGKDTRLVVNTLPHAECRLTSEREQDTAGSLDFATDYEGVAEVELRFDDVGKKAPLLLACRNPEGRVQVNRVLVEAREGADDPPGRVVHGVQRPALDGDPERITQAELVTRGYPRRPALGTEAYTNWLRIVSQPATTITPDLVIYPDTFHSAQPSANWSGYVTGTAPSHPGKYDLAYGDWYVQSTAGNAGRMSMWVGIDGWDTGDHGGIIQDGTDTVGMFLIGTYMAVSSTWIEYFPEPMVKITNFPVSAGQEVFFEAWPCNSDGTDNLAGPYGCYYFYNYSSQLDGFVSRKRPSGATFSGSTAEWILERPKVGGSFANLLRYGAQHIYSPGADESVLGGMSANQCPNGFIANMYEGSTLISSASNTGGFVTFIRH